MRYLLWICNTVHCYIMLCARSALSMHSHCDNTNTHTLCAADEYSYNIPPVNVLSVVGPLLLNVSPAVCVGICETELSL